MTIQIGGVWGFVLFVVCFLPAFFCGLGVIYGAKYVIKNYLRFGRRAEPYRRWKYRRRQARQAALTEPWS